MTAGALIQPRPSALLYARKPISGYQAQLERDGAEALSSRAEFFSRMP